MTEAEKAKKEKKAAYDKAYREKKKAEKITAAKTDVKKKATPIKAKPEVVATKKKATIKSEKETKVIETFTKEFGFPVRLYWNRNIDQENSSCARPNTELTFEKIGEVKGEDLYRVRRGKRNFFTVKSELSEK
jgi:hypothetical protein